MKVSARHCTAVKQKKAGCSAAGPRYSVMKVIRLTHPSSTLKCKSVGRTLRINASSSVHCPSTLNCDDHHNQHTAATVWHPQVVLVAPLTRCLQTAQVVLEAAAAAAAVQASMGASSSGLPRAEVEPLLRPRLMSCADVGRRHADLAAEFPMCVHVFVCVDICMSHAPATRMPLGCTELSMPTAQLACPEAT